MSEDLFLQNPFLWAQPRPWDNDDVIEVPNETRVENNRPPSPVIRRTRKRKQASRNISSFIISQPPRRGVRLIKVKVYDLCGDNEKAVISVQYVQLDAIDEIMDLTDNLVQKMSKNILNN